MTTGANEEIPRQPPALVPVADRDLVGGLLANVGVHEEEQLVGDEVGQRLEKP